MLKLIVYLIVGYVTIFCAMLIHLIRAESKGYAAIDWWDKNNPIQMYDATGTTVIRFLFGIMIWPIRVIQFLTSISDLYELYDHKQ